MSQPTNTWLCISQFQACPSTPGDSHVLTARGIQFSPNHICPGSRGFGSESFSTVLKEKCRNFSICFKETGGSLQIRCSCAVSYRIYQFLRKQLMSTVFLIRYVLFWVILENFSGHPRITFANTRSSLNFCVSNIARTIVKIPSVSRLFLGVFWISRS